MRQTCLGLLMILQIAAFSQASLDFVSNLPYPNKLNDIWGYVDGTGTEYALVGVRTGLSIVSLADPNNPQEVSFLPGPESAWRDIKTWGTHAYVVNETGQGMLIVDLSGLPTSVDTLWYRDRELTRAHNLFIDENGYAYIVGADIDNGGATILDLNADPEAPVFVGAYTDRYVHDTYVRNDTMYNAEIANGLFTIVDVTDKSAPTLLGSVSSPMGFAHNTWLSDDGQTAFITDEYPGASVTSYNVSDPTDIQELYQYRSNEGTGVIPHNVFVLNDYLITSYYRDGVTITDGHRPSNLVQLTDFDTSPLPSAGEFNGCWGVYPYLPSGLVIASDIEEGLFVLSPVFDRAAYLEGQVTEAAAGTPLLYSKVEILGTSASQVTGFTGEYALGAADSGLYVVRVSASGCATQLIDSVSLTKGMVTILNPVLSCTSTAIIPTNAVLLPEMSISPSLFSNSTTVDYELIGGSGELIVYDSRGRVRFQTGLQGGAGKVVIGSDFEPGYYLISLYSGESRKQLSAIKH